MATTPVFVTAPTGQTLVLKIGALPAVGALDPAVANGAGDTLTELTNLKGWYKADVTEALDGMYVGVIESGGTAIGVMLLKMADTTAPVFPASLELSQDRGEPGAIAAPENLNALGKIDWLYKNFANKAEQDGTETWIYNYAGDTVDNKRAVADTGVGGKTSRGNVVAGP